MVEVYKQKRNEEINRKYELEYLIIDQNSLEIIWIIHRGYM